MKPLHATTIVILLGLTACAAIGQKPSHVTVTPTIKKESIVPLPGHTPFDDDPVARAAYLESFEHGYRIGLTGYVASYHMTYTTHWRAHSEGYLAGQAAGSAAHESKEKETPNQSPEPTRSARGSS